MNELKPCPFCGGEVVIYYSSATKAFFAAHKDKSDCLIYMPVILSTKGTLAEAYEKWNRRTEK